MWLAGLTSRRRVARWGLVPALMALIIAANVNLAPPAHAGTPYTCSCDGKLKRFIGGTYFCGRRTPACTSREYRAFRRNACAANACRVPK